MKEVEINLKKENAMSQTSEVGQRMNTTDSAINNTVAMKQNGLSEEIAARMLRRLEENAFLNVRELHKLGQTLGLTVKEMISLGYATMESGTKFVLQKKGIDALNDSYNKLIAAEQQEQVIPKATNKKPY